MGAPAVGQENRVAGLPHSFFNASPYRVEYLSENFRPYASWQTNYAVLKSVTSQSSDTVYAFKASVIFRDSVFLYRVPVIEDTAPALVFSPTLEEWTLSANSKPAAPSLDIAMKLEIVLGQLSDSLTLLEKKHSDYIKTGNKGMSLIGVGILVTGLCVGDLTDKYPNTSLQKTSLRAGIAAGSMMTAYGIFEVLRYLTRRHDFKSMETRLGSYTEGDIRRLMNTERQ